MSVSSAEMEEFKIEAFELLDIAEKSLLGMDEGEDFNSCFNAIFRSLHNLKGGAGMMELDELRDHTHKLETIFTQFQDQGSIPHQYLSLFLKGVDAARLMLSGEEISFSYEVKKEIPLIKINQEFTPPQHSLSNDEFITSCYENLENISRCIHQIESDNFQSEIINNLYRYVHSLKGDAYLFSFHLVGDIAHAMETALEPLKNKKHTIQKSMINCLYKAIDVIELLLQRPVHEHERPGLRKIADVICRALEKASLVSEIEIASELPKVIAKEEKEVSNSSIRVSVSLLDSLMALMGEMVLVRNQVLQFSNKTEDLEFLSMSKRLNVITSEIQEQMMKTRMQAIGNVFAKFNRVVRDLAGDLGKNINLHIEGSETELDRSLLEAIKDPLTHIVRNSCDHGIETPEVRLEKGKPSNGRIEIKAYHEGGQVFIEVKDDGKGLSRQHIINKALEKNLITSSEAQGLSDKEAFELIFLPGFSTASQVSNVSGRGVGMDVVRTNIERIGGNVELSGEENVGTTIKIKIPLTLAIIPALMVKCGGATFAIPQLKLEELVRVDLEDNPHQIETLYGAAMYRLRGNLLQLVDMNVILGESNSFEVGNKTVFNIAVLNADGNLFGVIIDEILDTADIVVKPLNRVLKSLQIYSGATVLGDGSVALIFDVMGITKVAQINFENNKTFSNAESTVSEFQEFLLFKLNSSSTHAIALSYVDRIEEFRSSDIEYSGKQMVIRYRGEILPLVAVNDQLDYGKQGFEEVFPVIVIERAGIAYGLIVNKIIDTLSTAEEVKTPIQFYQGLVGNIHTPKELIVVIDPFQIVDKSLGIYHEAIQVTNVVHADIKKVLLVEDTVFFRRFIQGFLEKHGYQVVIAQNGKEAIDVLNQEGSEISLVISDIEMPQMNGFEMARAIRKYPHYKDLPMIAVSSKADKNYRQEGMKAGFDLYLEKLRPEVLLSAISEFERKMKVVA
ncbi:MAG: chemotaxis protein CheW [Bacteriovoracaceae bacterium]